MNAKCLISKKTRGFSLIELMVVIAIVALLTAIAVPSYKTYLNQSKVTEIFSLASDQLKKYQQYNNLGSAFGVATSNLGNYIATAIVAGNGTAASSVSGGTNCSALTTGSVCIVLNAAAGTGIDASLSGLVIRYIPTTAGSVSGDTTNTTQTWTCNFVNATTSNATTAASLLSPGNCTGV